MVSLLWGGGFSAKGLGGGGFSAIGGACAMGGAGCCPCYRGGGCLPVLFSYFVL